MTAKDKARDLCDDFYDIKSNEPDYGIEWEMAKKCALIAVDEILKTDPMIENGISDAGFDYKPNDDYWYEVKSEIDKL